MYQPPLMATTLRVVVHRTTNKPTARGRVSCRGALCSPFALPPHVPPPKTKLFGSSCNSIVALPATRLR